MARRVTRAAIHVLTLRTSEPAAPARVTRAAIHVLVSSAEATPPESLGEVSFTASGTLTTGSLQSLGVADAVYATALSVDVVTESRDESFGVQSSLLGAEVLNRSDDWVRSSQLAAEVILTAAFDPQPCEPCNPFPVVYRLRIRNAADTEDALVVSSSLTEADSLIVEPPRIDGQQFDPLTGKTTVGGASVLVVDPEAGALTTTPDGTDRPITGLLADALGNQQLLGRKAFLEISRQVDPVTFAPHFGGYVTSVSLVDGITYEIGLAHTTRDDETTSVWGDNTYIWTSSAQLLGGPVSADVPTADTSVVVARNIGSWVADVIAVYDTYVHLDINEDLCAAFPPPDLRDSLQDRGWIRLSDNDEQRNVFRWAQQNCQKFFVRGYPSSAAETEWLANPAGAIRGYMPRVRVNFLTKNDVPIAASANMMASYERTVGAFGLRQMFDTLCWEDLGNHFYVAWGDDNPVAQPEVGDRLTFRAVTEDVSEASPRWLVGHPVTILQNLLAAYGLTVNTANLTAIRAKVGVIQVALRITKAYTMAEAVAMLCGAFGMGVRAEDDGTRTIFCWRVREDPETLDTITYEDIVSVSNQWWRVDESSRLFSAEWKFQRFDSWPGEGETAEKDRALDGVVAVEERPIVFQADLDQPAQSRTQTYEVPGCLLTNGGARIPSLVDVCAAWADQTFGVYAYGGIITELDCLCTVTAQVGDEVILDLPVRPGFDSLLTPPAQRGINEVCLVIGRTPTPYGSRLTLLRVPSETLPAPDPDPDPSPPAVPDPLDESFSLALGTDPTTDVDITLDDTTDWATASAALEVQTFNQPTVPTGSALRDVDGRFWSPPTTPLELGPFTPGTTVWVRVRRVALTGEPIGLWSSFQSIVMDAGTSVAPPGTVQSPGLSWTVDATTGDVDLIAETGPEAVKVYATISKITFPDEAAILAGLSDSAAPFAFTDMLSTLTLDELELGENGYIGAIAEDALGNLSVPTFATAYRELPANVRSAAIVIIFDGGGSALAGGEEVDIQVPFRCRVTGWTLLADAVGSAEIDLWVDTFANFPPTVADSIVDTDYPDLVAAQSATGNASLWTTDILEDESVIRAHINSAATVTRVTLSLRVQRLGS